MVDDWKAAGGRSKCFRGPGSVGPTPFTNFTKLDEPHASTPSSDWIALKELLRTRGLTSHLREAAILEVVPEVYVSEVLDLRGKVVSEGKGFCPEAAQISALAEAVERTLAQADQPGPLWLSSTAELDAYSIPRPGNTCGTADLYSSTLPMEWVPAWTFDGIAGAISAEAAFYPFDPATGVRAFCAQSTVGLAAGITLGGAGTAGLRECIETDAYWLSMRTGHVEANLGGLRDAPDHTVRRIVCKLADAGIRVHAGLIRFDWPVPIVHVVLETTEESLPALSHGLGAAWSVPKALKKALLEAIQVYSGLEKVAALYWPEIVLSGDAVAEAQLAWSDHRFRRRIIDPIEEAPLRRAEDVEPHPIAQEISALDGWMRENGLRTWAAQIGSMSHLKVVRVQIEGAVSPFSERNGPSERVLATARRLGLRFPYLDPVLS